MGDEVAFWDADGLGVDIGRGSGNGDVGGALGATDVPDSDDAVATACCQDIVVTRLKHNLFERGTVFGHGVHSLLRVHVDDLGGLVA